MKLIFIWLSFFILFISSSYSQTYNWPCTPFTQQHYINGTFCENRPSGDILRDHFHDGVDINLSAGNNVYSVINGTVTSIGTVSQYGINSYVRVGRYAYVHVIPNPSLSVGSSVTAFQTILGTTNSWNHIHFKDGYPGSEINPLRSGGGFDPFDDALLPYIVNIKYYINGTTTQFSNNRVSGLVDIVSQAYDNTDTGPLGSNNGTYSIGYQIFDSSGTTALTSEIINFVFDNKPSNSYITNVYFSGSDLSTYIYTLTNRITSDGYWDTRSFDPGFYRVKVFTEDTRMNTYEKWSTVEVMTQDLTPPSDPVLTSVLKTAANEWTISWLPNDSLDINGYRLYFSFDGINWNFQQDISNQIAVTDTSFTFTNYPNESQIYFRLSAYDDAPIPNHSDSSDAYGVRLSDINPGILIVDGFDRIDGYWQNSAHTFAVRYGESLSDLHVPFITCSNEAVTSGNVDLQNYDAVIYLLGDESGQSKALDADEQLIMKSYLRNGGKLIISGSDIGYDLLMNGNSTDSLFYSEFLKSKFIADSVSGLNISGKSGTMFENFSGEINVPLANTIRPDVIDTLGSIPILSYSDGSIAGIYFNGLFPGGTLNSHLIYIAFPIELINGNTQHTELISLILSQMEIISAVPEYGNEIGNEYPNSIKLFDNYPNPFNPATTIEFYLPENDYVKLKIYDMNGNEITTLVSGKLAPGNHKFIWNASQYASGVYYYNLKSGQFSKTKKLILMK